MTSILGVSRMGSSFFEGNRPEIASGISDIIREKNLLYRVEDLSVQQGTPRTLPNTMKR